MNIEQSFRLSSQKAEPGQEYELINANNFIHYFKMDTKIVIIKAQREYANT